MTIRPLHKINDAAALSLALDALERHESQGHGKYGECRSPACQLAEYVLTAAGHELPGPSCGALIRGRGLCTKPVDHKGGHDCKCRKVSL